MLQTMGIFKVGLNAFLHFDMVISLWDPESKKLWLEKTWSLKGVASVTGVALLE